MPPPKLLVAGAPETAEDSEARRADLLALLAERERNLRSRVLFAVAAGLCFTPFVGATFAGPAMLAALLSCWLDRDMWRMARARVEAGGGMAAVERFAPRMALISCLYGMMAPIMWLRMPADGDMIAAFFLAAMASHSIITLRSAPKLMLGALAPTALWIVGSPIVEIMLSGRAANWRDLGVVVGIGFFASFCGSTLRSLADADTARRSAMAEALRERRAAEAADRAKSRFLRVVTDELRTPMRAFMGAAEGLRRAALPEPHRAHVDMIGAAGSVMTAVLDDLSDLRHVDGGEVEIKPEPADLRALVRDVVAVWRPQAEDKWLELIVDVDEATPSVVMIDAVRLRQILFNLLSNAVAQTHHGGVRLALRCAPGRADRAKLSFVVADAGPGLSPAEMSRLFEPGAAGRAGGPGFGLAVSRKLADLMGGSLTVRSALGEGAEFTFAVEAPIAQVTQRDSQRPVRTARA